jgi:hypothetical protein
MKKVATDVGYLSREKVKLQTLSARLYECCFEFHIYLAYGLMYGYFHVYGISYRWMDDSGMDELIF